MCEALANAKQCSESINSNQKVKNKRKENK